MLVHPLQKENPLLRHVHHVKFDIVAEAKDMLCDYLCGASATVAVLYISLKYHVLKPQYLEMRMREMGDGYKVRILLCRCDMDECTDTLLALNKLAFTRNFTLILAWSNEEAARYLESFHIYEGKSAASIQEKVENEYMPLAVKAFTTIKPINRTDVSTLLNNFGSIADICQAEENQLVLCPGLGDKKVRRLYDVLHTPFNA